MQSSDVCCEICNASFQRREHYERHIRTHTQQKPFSCTECGQRFGRVYDTGHPFQMQHLNQSADSNTETHWHAIMPPFIKVTSKGGIPLVLGVESARHARRAICQKSGVMGVSHAGVVRKNALIVITRLPASVKQQNLQCQQRIPSTLFQWILLDTRENLNISSRKNEQELQQDPPQPRLHSNQIITKPHLKHWEASPTMAHLIVCHPP